MAASKEVDVPSGAVLAAIRILEILASREDEPSEAVGEEIATFVKAWSVVVLTQAFSLLIGAAMMSVQQRSGKPDRLHDIVPAVLTRPRRTGLAEPALATMGGVLTAGALEEDPYQWRQNLGPVTNGEALAWCYTAWLIGDFLDHI